MPRWAIAVLLPTCAIALALGAFLAWPRPARAGTFASDDPQLGRRAYVFCQACHGLDGQGVAGNYPPLSGSAFLTGDPRPAIRLILSGSRPDRLNGRMPAFAATMSDHEIAAVVNHVRSRWGDGHALVTPAQVAAERRP